MEKKRVSYFDMAKGLGVVLVLIGHLQTSQIMSFSPYIIKICGWIFSFHMPLFFIISGMLIHLKKDTEKELSVLAKKRFKGIMVPYMWFTLFYLIAIVYLVVKSQMSFSIILDNIFYALSTYGINVLWFLPCLFFAELLFLAVFQRFSDKIRVIVYVLCAILGHFAGYLLKSHPVQEQTLKHVYEFIITCIRPLSACAFIAIGYYVFALFQEREKFHIGEFALGIGLMLADMLCFQFNQAVDFRTMVLNNLFLYYFCSVSGSLGLILICRNLKPVKLVTYWGVNSLVFMVVHNLQTPLFYAQKLAMYINQFLTRARGYCCYAIVITSLLCYTTIMIWLVNHVAGFIVGKPCIITDMIFKNKGRKHE